MRLAAQELSGVFGVKLPLSGPAQPNPSSTLTASIAFSNVVGLQQIAVGLSGSWTAGQMASKSPHLSKPP